MAAPITWRNVNAVSQGDANRLLRAGSDQLQSSISGLANIAGRLGQDQKKQINKQKEDATQSLLNQINNMDSASLAKAKGAFDPDSLGQQVGNKNVAILMNALEKRDQDIFDESQKGIKRQTEIAQNQNALTGTKVTKINQEDKLEKYAQNQKIKTGNSLIDGVLTDREIDGDIEAQIDQIKNFMGTGQVNRLQGEQAIAKLKNSDDIVKQLSPNQLKQLKEDQAVQEDILNQGVQRIQSELNAVNKQLAGSVAPLRGTEEYAKQAASLNAYIDKARKGDRYFFADLDTVKQEVANTAERLGASPAQAEAAFGQVVDGDGDYTSEEFETQLRALLDDPQSDALKARRDILQINLEQAKMALPSAKRNIRKTLEDEYIKKFNF